jgi:uncharacterized protein with LGFP repeats
VISNLLDILFDWRHNNYSFPITIKSEPSVSQSSAVPRPFGTPIASPTQEHKWRRHILVLSILTVAMSLVAIIVAVTTSRKSDPEVATSAESVEVWADDHTGRYFCPDSAWYGKTREGRHLTQREARFAGFRPTDGKPCVIAQLSQ